MNQIYIRGNEIATKEYVDSLSFEGGNVDLSNYYTKEEINNIISETNNSIQVEEMPDASEENVGTIVQYIGITNENYTTSNFYQVVEQTVVNEDGSETTIYVWEEISTPEINLDEYATKEYVNESLTNIDLPQSIYTIYINVSPTATFSASIRNTIMDYINKHYLKTSKIPSFLLIYEGAREVMLYTFQRNETTGDKRLEFSGHMHKASGIYSYTEIIGCSQTIYYSGELGSATSSSCNSSKTIDKLLPTTNKYSYTPTDDYNPATKKYVDETVAANAGGDKLSDYDIYTIELPHNLKGTYPNITDEESLTKFNQILTNIYRRKIITNSDYYKSFIIVYSQSDTFIFLCSNLGTYCNLYGTYIDEPIDNNGYTCAYKMYITGSLDETAQTYKATSVKFDRDSKRVLLTNNTLTFTPTSNYHPATKKYVDDTIATSIAGISVTSMSIATSLPTENISTSTIYLIKDETASTDSENIYNEYVYINGKWENIGSTKTTVDLSNYYNKQEINTMIGDINSLLDAINGEEV